MVSCGQGGWDFDRLKYISIWCILSCHIIIIVMSLPGAMHMQPSVAGCRSAAAEAFLAGRKGSRQVCAREQGFFS